VSGLRGNGIFLTPRGPLSVVTRIGSGLLYPPAGGDSLARIERFEEMEAWIKARDLAREVYQITSVGGFARDFGLRDQKQTFFRDLFFDQHGTPLLRILTDRGTEFCGRADRHE